MWSIRRLPTIVEEIDVVTVASIGFALLFAVFIFRCCLGRRNREIERSLRDEWEPCLVDHAGKLLNGRFAIDGESDDDGLNAESTYIVRIIADDHEGVMLGQWDGKQRDRNAGLPIVDLFVISAESDSDECNSPASDPEAIPGIDPQPQRGSPPTDH